MKQLCCGVGIYRHFKVMNETGRRRERGREKKSKRKREWKREDAELTKNDGPNRNERKKNTLETEGAGKRKKGRDRKNIRKVKQTCVCVRKKKKKKVVDMNHEIEDRLKCMQWIWEYSCWECHTHANTNEWMNKRETINANMNSITKASQRWQFQNQESKKL